MLVYRRIRTDKVIDSIFDAPQVGCALGQG